MSSCDGVAKRTADVDLGENSGWPRRLHLAHSEARPAEYDTKADETVQANR